MSAGQKNLQFSEIEYSNSGSSIKTLLLKKTLIHIVGLNLGFVYSKQILKIILKVSICIVRKIVNFESYVLFF